jgi:hypothetical protein
MSLLRSTFACGLTATLFAGLFSLSATARAGDFTGFLYVSDYKAATLDRYRYNYHQATNTIDNIIAFGTNGNTSNAVFITGNIKEGLQGTLNDIIVVNSGGATLTRYDLNGNSINTINVQNANGSVHTLRGIGNVLITQDGKYLYAPEETGSLIDKIDLATGKIVAFASFTGAHDLAISPDGSTIYAAAYNNSAADSKGVYAYSSDLNPATRKQVIAFNDNGLNGPSGMSVASDGSLYIQQNVHTSGGVGGGPDGIYHYKITGSGVNVTANFDAPSSLKTSANLHFTFGNNIGPDGNVYIAALGGASGRSGNSSYTDGVYKFDTSITNPTSTAVSLFIAGGINTGLPAGPSGLESPKYLQFGFNFVPAYDAGVVPEPSGILAGLGLLGMIGGGRLRARHRRRR